MTNTQLYILIAVPILVGVFQRFDTKRLEAKMERLEEKVEGSVKRLEDKMDAKLDSIQKDMREFYALLRVHDEQISELKKVK